ncbi:MAG: HD domain-containing phosphohydrolase, partial [Longimicrobiales bacterium]
SHARSGAWDAALDAYERALRALPADGGGEAAATILRSTARIRFERGQHDVAEDVLEASLAVAEANGLTEHIAAAVNGLGNVAQIRGDLDDAERLYSRGRRLALELEDHRLISKFDQNLGTIANIRGNVRGALKSYGSALASYRAIGDDIAAARVLNNIGMAYTDLGHAREAEACYSEAFDLADRQHDTETLGAIETNRAELFLSRRDFQKARESCDRAFEIFTHIQSRRWISEVHKLYGILYRETTKHGLAAHHFEQGIELAHASSDPLLQAETLREWALDHLAQGLNQDALQCLNRAHKLFEGLQARRDLLDLDHRLDDLEGTFLKVVRQWAETIESKDRYTAGHCERVANYACMLAAEVGIVGRDLTWMRMGGFLHDVGKIVVPTEVLNKPGKLTPEEWAQMQSHTTAGDEIVAKLDFPWDIRPIVRSHHERWDGGGYPDGLKGEEIPRNARILCVADVYDALTTARSYRPALSQEEALGIMDRDAGRLLDPELYPIFRTLIAEATITAAA